MFDLVKLKKDFEEGNALFANFINHTAGLEKKTYSFSDAEAVSKSDKATAKYLTAILGTIAGAVVEITGSDATRFRHDVVTNPPKDMYSKSEVLLGNIFVLVKNEWVSLKETYPEADYELLIQTGITEFEYVDLLKSVIWTDLFRIITRTQKEFYVINGLDISKVTSNTTDGSIVKSIEDLYWFD